MIMRKLFTVFVISGMIVGCDAASKTQQTPTVQIEYRIPSQEHSIQAVLWQQHSAEYRALCEQAYNYARLSLDAILDTATVPVSKLAIVTDLDETVIDNSPFNAKMIELDEAYTREIWIEWGNQISAKAMPGAVEFFKYAADRGVETFYISNRYAEQLDATIENLKKLDLPFVDEKHVMLRGESSEKVSRRKKVEETHRIIMLLGDNLADFSGLFEFQQSPRRHELVDSLRAEFGSRFIMLPNVIYGDWQTNGIYEGRYDWTEFQLDSIRRSKLISY